MRQVGDEHISLKSRSPDQLHHARGRFGQEVSTLRSVSHCDRGVQAGRYQESEEEMLAARREIDRLRGLLETSKMQRKEPVEAAVSRVVYLTQGGSRGLAGYPVSG